MSASPKAAARLARGITRCEDHGNPGGDWALLVDHLEEARPIDGPQAHRQVGCGIPAGGALPILPADEMAGLWKTHGVVRISLDDDTGKVGGVRVCDQHMRDLIWIDAHNGQRGRQAR